MRVTALRLALALTCAAVLSGCASNYAPSSLTGGYAEKDLGDGTMRVSYFGNGYTTAETVQTYWLYHCAELAMAKGYDGFRILSPITLSAVDALRQPSSAEGGIIKTASHSGGYTVHTYSYTVQQMAKPSITADIHFIRRPFTPVLAKVFDASQLEATLRPLVKGKLCGGNVCAHAHTYIYGAPGPDGRL